MLRTRLWMGAVLVVVALGVLLVDQWLEPWFPSLFAVLVAASVVAIYELTQLLNAIARPLAWVCYPAVLGVAVANWPVHVAPSLVQSLSLSPAPWDWVLGALTAGILLAFLAEIAVYQASGVGVPRLALTLLTVVYLGLLPCFLVQLRWLSPGPDGVARGTWALVLTIFVPKCGDIGAYFAGRFVGRNRMTPLLSPKKTWEGFAGGLAAAVLAALALNRVGGVLADDVRALGFGLTVGLAGVAGDLAESMIKRDCGQKDASQVVPGFGGVLDVVDAIVFAAPVAYWWLR